MLEYCSRGSRETRRLRHFALVQHLLNFTLSLQQYSNLRDNMITSYFAPKCKQGTRSKRNLDDDDAVDALEIENKRSKDESTQRAFKPNSLRVEVQELLSHLHSEPLSGEQSCITWRQALSEHFSSPSFARLAQFVAEERYER